MEWLVYNLIVEELHKKGLEVRSVPWEIVSAFSQAIAKARMKGGLMSL